MVSFSHFVVGFLCVKDLSENRSVEIVLIRKKKHDCFVQLPVYLSLICSDRVNHDLSQKQRHKAV